MEEKLIERLKEVVSMYNESTPVTRAYYLGKIHGITDACLYAGIHHTVEFSADWNTATVKILYVEGGE